MIKNLLLVGALAITLGAGAETIWEGEKTIDWWANAIEMPMTDFENAEIGNAMTITYVCTDADAGAAFKLQALHDDWSQSFFTSYATDMPEDANDYVYNSTEDGTLKFNINEHDYGLMTDETNQCIMLVGENVVITKVTLGQEGDNGISNVVEDSAEGAYYSLTGVLVAHPANGIFVKKQGHKVSKVIVR